MGFEIGRGSPLYGRDVYFSLMMETIIGSENPENSRDVLKMDTDVHLTDANVYFKITSGRLIAVKLLSGVQKFQDSTALVHTLLPWNRHLRPFPKPLTTHTTNSLLGSSRRRPKWPACVTSIYSWPKPQLQFQLLAPHPQCLQLISLFSRSDKTIIFRSQGSTPSTRHPGAASDNTL